MLFDLCEMEDNIRKDNKAHIITCVMIAFKRQYHKLHSQSIFDQIHRFLSRIYLIYYLHLTIKSCMRTQKKLFNQADKFSNDKT